MELQEMEAEKYAHECSMYDGLNPTFDIYDAKEMRECGFMKGYETAIANLWINKKHQQPEDGAHCFIKKRIKNEANQWQWNYGIADYYAPTSKKQVAFFKIYDMVVRLDDVTHWMLIPE